MVTPDRVIVPRPRPFDAPAGIVPFHRMLASENLASPSQSIMRPVDRYEPSAPIESNLTPKLSPKLGEVLPIEIEPVIETKVQTTTQVQLPATGRLIDVYL